jgi:transposase InsO family protein
MLWVSYFTYVSTWQDFVYVAFIIDTFADKIEGLACFQLTKNGLCAGCAGASVA